MKKYFYILTVLLLPFLGGCEKEMMSYEGTRGIYFSVRWGDAYFSTSHPYWSYSNIDFVKVAGNTHTAMVKVMITDAAVAYDRTFKFAIDPDATTAKEGVDYEIPTGEGIIPAGAVEGYAAVVLYRTPLLETQELRLALKLLPNENFELVFTSFVQPPEYNGSILAIEQKLDMSKHQLRINDVTVKPANWLGGYNQYGNLEEFNALGVFSPKKFRLICELFDLTYDDFMDATIMTSGYMNVLGRRLGAYLIEQYRNHTPVLENDGRLMWSSDCKWKSYENVPWDGTYDESYYY